MRATALLALSAICAPAQTRAPGNETILRDQLKADLHYLASDAMRGRLTGSAEAMLAARFVESRMARLGLRGLGAEGSLFHRFDLYVARLGQANRLEAGVPDKSMRVARVREDFYPTIFSASGRARGNVVFAGYGVVAPVLKWDDYRGRTVAGSVVVALDGDPQPDNPSSLFDGVVTSEYSNALRKTLWAQERGAAAVLIVNARGAGKGTNGFLAGARAYWPDSPAHLERYTLAAQGDRIRIPTMMIAPALAESLLPPGKTLADLVKAADAGDGWVAAPAGTEVSLTASVSRNVVEDRSAVAVLDGADPVLKNEAVIVSAHYDHNGQDRDQLYAGADDNGSGTVALLEIAEAYALAAAQGRRPKRSVIFASWGAEERCCGPLLGAWAWVENPAWPLEKTVGVLNMDMIGRSEEVPEGGGARFNGLKQQTAASNASTVNILGWSFNPELSAMVDGANHVADLRLLRRYDNNRSNLLRRSDQWPFLQTGVPALFFHTGLHPDYHTIYDRPERIDYAKVERVARLVHQLSWDLANREGRVKFLSPRPVPPLEEAER